MTSTLRISSILTLLTLSLTLPGAPALAADDFKMLPQGAGRDLTVKVCSQCHSPEIIAHQSLNAQGWKDLVNQMASNGANATDAEFDTISKYLAASFPPK